MYPYQSYGTNSQISSNISSTSEAKKGFRRLNRSQDYSQESPLPQPIVVNDPKEELISKFSTDIKNYYGFNDDPRRAKALHNYIKTQPKSITHCKGNIEQKAQVDNYYQVNVTNRQNNLNQSCYKNYFPTTKEDYANTLKKQIEQKERMKQEAKIQDKAYIERIVQKEKADSMNERSEKIQYIQKINNEFKEQNKDMLKIKRSIKECRKEQEIIDSKKQLKVIEKGEKQLIVKEDYKQYKGKQYFTDAMVKQIGAKNIQKRRMVESARNSSM